ncbi:MAG: HAD family hydrolase [Puniceicoccales bacterium]
MKDEGQQGGVAAGAVIFDVDGTLYWQKGLRRRMLVDLLSSALFSSRTRLDLRILKRFREDRETLGERVDSGFAEAQYRLTAEALGLTPERVEDAVRRWIYERPLRYLRKHRVPGIEVWLEKLRAAGVRSAVYSEYPAVEKLAALGLSFDAVVSSTDPDVDAFKPNPKGIQVALEKLGVPAERALFVGDRQDRDGACAAAAGLDFLWVDRSSAEGLSSFPPPRQSLPDYLKETGVA